MTTAQKLERLHNRATRYEVVAEHQDGRRYLVGYTSRPSRQGIAAIIRQNAEHVVRKLALPADAEFTISGKGRFGHVFTVPGGWSMRLTGRTQRDAIIGGELEFVAD